LSKSSKRWLARQRRDPYVRRAAEGDLGSRAHFKLEQLDKRFSLIGARTGGVLDLGAAPGGWTRYVVSRGPRGPIVAVDLRPMPPIAGVEVLTIDLRDPDAMGELARTLPSGADLVLSDMAPNISGVKAADRAASEALVEIATETALVLLNPGGSLVVKMFQGAEVDGWVTRMREVFERVVLSKPDASRVRSREVYGVALKRRRPASTLLEGETHV
jgi:23S rRNA (uridine2552-2'-O)-methyltransferase